MLLKMKRFCLLIVLLAAATAAYAQKTPVANDAPIIPEKETVVVDNFTAVPNLTLGFYQYARQCILEGLSYRRINVIDVEQDGYGRPDIVYPAPEFANAGAGHPFDINRVARLMNDYPEVRWYLTAYISRIHNHPVDHQSKDKDGKPVVRTDFTAEVEADIYLFDMETQEGTGPIHWKSTYTGGHDPAHAEQHVISYLSQKARSFVTDFFRYKASVIKLGEYNRRGKLQDLYLSCGSDIDVERGDVFHIYSVSLIDGVESMKKLGKVKAREVTGRESCRCTVSSGEADIDRAFKAGETLVAVSDNDRLF